jgi:hypothetical protein
MEGKPLVRFDERERKRSVAAWPKLPVRQAKLA